MEIQQIEDQLLGFVKREVFAPQFAVTPETDLVAAGFDSMSLVRLLLFVEMTYGLWIPPEEIKAETLRDLRSLSAAIFRLLHAKSTASQRL